MSSFDQLLLFILVATVGVGVGKLVLAVKHPEVYEKMEAMDEKRRERMKKTAVGAAKFGMDAYRMLRK